MHTSLRLSFAASLLAALSASALAGCTVNSSDGGGGSSFDDDDDTSGVGGAATTDGVCSSTNETDSVFCDEDCDVAVAGEDGVFECTVSCDPGLQDCGTGDVCLELTDGTGACVEDCAGGVGCSDPEDACDVELEVCLPGTAPTTDDQCYADNVSDPADCDADCDAAIDGGVGVYQCTTSCDPDLQDCGDDSLYCQETDAGTAACYFDCSGTNTCPGEEWVCDEEYLICVPLEVTES